MRHFFKDFDSNLKVSMKRVTIKGALFKDNNVELATFLPMWLWGYKLQGTPTYMINSRVLPVAAMLATGMRIALGPIFLHNLCHLLDRVHDDLERSLGRYDITNYMDSTFCKCLCGSGSSRVHLKKLITLNRKILTSNLAHGPGVGSGLPLGQLTSGY